MKNKLKFSNFELSQIEETIQELMPAKSQYFPLHLGSSLQTLTVLLTPLTYVSFLCRRYKNTEKGRSQPRLQVVWGEGQVRTAKVRTREAEGEESETARHFGSTLLNVESHGSKETPLLMTVANPGLELLTHRLVNSVG